MQKHFIILICSMICSAAPSNYGSYNESAITGDGELTRPISNSSESMNEATEREKRLDELPSDYGILYVPPLPEGEQWTSSIEEDDELNAAVDTSNTMQDISSTVFPDITSKTNDNSITAIQSKSLNSVETKSPNNSSDEKERTTFKSLINSVKKTTSLYNNSDEKEWTTLRPNPGRQSAVLVTTSRPNTITEIVQKNNSSHFSKPYEGKTAKNNQQRKLTEDNGTQQEKSDYPNMRITKQVTSEKKNYLVPKSLVYIDKRGVMHGITNFYSEDLWGNLSYYGTS